MRSHPGWLWWQLPLKDMGLNWLFSPSKTRIIDCNKPPWLSLEWGGRRAIVNELLFDLGHFYSNTIFVQYSRGLAPRESNGLHIRLFSISEKSASPWAQILEVDFFIPSQWEVYVWGQHLQSANIYNSITQMNYERFHVNA